MLLIYNVPAPARHSTPPKNMSYVTYISRALLHRSELSKITLGYQPNILSTCKTGCARPAGGLYRRGNPQRQSLLVPNSTSIAKSLRSGGAHAPLRSARRIAVQANNSGALVALLDPTIVYCCGKDGGRQSFKRRSLLLRLR